MTDKELAIRLGKILNAVGRLEGRAVAMRDVLRDVLRDDEDYADMFSDEFEDGITDSILVIENEAKACMEAISGPIEFDQREGGEEGADDGTLG